MLKRLVLSVILFVLVCQSPALPGSLDRINEQLGGKLDISGQIRLRAESRSNYDFDSNADTTMADDGFLLSRIRLNFDVNPVDKFRIFIELQDSHQFGTDIPTSRRLGPGAFEDRIDFFQVYADIKNIGDLPLTIRLGRQTISLDAQRLVGAFAWSNVGRSFQGARLILTPDPVDLQVWWANVVVPEDDHLNEADWKDDFYGIHATWKNLPRGKLETYILYRDKNDIGRKIYTIGGRFRGVAADRTIDYDAEIAFQKGDFSSSIEHSALALHAGLGHTFKKMKLKPRIGLQYNFATGDGDVDSLNTENSTFDNLYPTNHLHYGSMDFLSWRNVHNVKIESNFKPCEWMTIKGDLHFFRVAEVTDAWYNAGGAVIRPQDPSRSADASLGKEIDITAICECSEYLQLMVGYSQFFPGSFVEATGESDSPKWFFVQTTFPL
jgi:hypothetical protein